MMIFNIKTKKDPGKSPNLYINGAKFSFTDIFYVQYS